MFIPDFAPEIVADYENYEPDAEERQVMEELFKEDSNAIPHD